MAGHGASLRIVVAIALVTVSALGFIGFVRDSRSFTPNWLEPIFDQWIGRFPSATPHGLDAPEHEEPFQTLDDSAEEDENQDDVLGSLLREQISVETRSEALERDEVIAQLEEPATLEHAAADEKPPADGKPDILFILVDDLGWGDVGFTENLFSRKVLKDSYKQDAWESDPESYAHSVMDETSTSPDARQDFANYMQRLRELHAASKHITALARKGRLLARHYVHNTCSPSRSALQTGRLPVHVQMSLLNPCHPSAGIPKDMTGIAEKMRSAGYSTHFVGKWDAGMETPTHIPHGRGYDTSLNFFSHGNWMWTEDVWIGSLINATRPPRCTLDRGCARDLWDTDRPASTLNGTLYEERLFANRVLKVIRETPIEKPLFTMYHPRVAHYPLQAPWYSQLAMSFINNPHRRVYLSMLHYLDGVVGEIVAALHATKRWDRTLIVFGSDNGGVVKTPGRCVEATRGLACFNGEAGANNYPLKGGKYTDYEGGIRVASFISGGFVPKEVRGTVVKSMIHISDWYATFCALAGVDPTDEKAAKAKLPPIDSIDQSKAILYTKNSMNGPRETIILSKISMVWRDIKLLQGIQYGSSWAGPLYPNVTTAIGRRDVYSRTSFCYPACMYNLTEDPTERHDISKSQPELLKTVMEELARQAKNTWFRPRTEADPMCFITARDRWKGFLGPWKELRVK